MLLLPLILIGILFLVLGYFIYGSLLHKIFRLDAQAKTPAFEFRDDRDFVPTKPFYLLGQHLSAIAAAGPIVGPILAGMWFGWLPTLLWIILGGIFIGGVHDMAAIIGSVRHQGKSVAEIIREHMSKKAFILFLLFLWFSIIYIITAFADITASTFVDQIVGSKVASSSMMYLGLAFVMGVILRYSKLPLGITTVIFMPLVFVCIYLGQFFPLSIPVIPGLTSRATWDIVLLVYCFFAAIIPVWLLLQPRGYLGGFFLSATALASFIGIVIGNFTQHTLIQYPAFTRWITPQGLPLLPLLFTTVACGACSGFHAIVSSGTTSKQIHKETDVIAVGFGGMLLESFVAIIALATLLIVTPHAMHNLKDPNQIFANGIAVFLNNLGIHKDFALNFALLAFATFVYDTLDVATRLGRYIFQELTSWHTKTSTYIATLATLALPAFFVTRTIKDAQGTIVPVWKIFWTIFGSSNQLLAAMVLLGISVWMFRKRLHFTVTFIPAIFMIVVAVLSLIFVLRQQLLEKFSLANPMVITGVILLILVVFLIIEAVTIFTKHRG